MRTWRPSALSPGRDLGQAGAGPGSLAVLQARPLPGEPAGAGHPASQRALRGAGRRALLPGQARCPRLDAAYLPLAPSGLAPFRPGTPLR
jgi:hypothetical protein